MNSHQPMLSPVLELVQSVDSFLPHGNHTMFQKLWDSETQLLLDESLELSEATEKEKTEGKEVLDLVSSALSIFTREAENLGWKQLSLEQRKAKVKHIQESPQIPQRSEEWYRNYGKVLTASEFSALFLQNKRRKDLVYSKARPSQDMTTNYRTACPTEEMNAIGWGIRFEPVVKLLLEHKEKWTIYEPGRLNHPTNTHLAASPDGVIASSGHAEQVARLVEIKCPYSRALGGEIPSDYWIQMQIQMEVCDIDECEYVECDFVSRRAKQETNPDLSETTYQGVIFLLKEIVEDDEPFEYRYIYSEIGSQDRPPIPEGFECLEAIPWGLKRLHRVLVQRDRHWYTSTLPWQEAFWNDVEKVRKGDDLPQTPVKPTPCLITDD